MRFAYAEEVPVLRWQANGVDRYGNPVAAWVTAPPLRCMVADQAAVMEFSPGRIEVDFDYALYAEPGQTVLDSDRLTVRGHSCKVVKPHFEWVNLAGQAPGATVYVKAVEG